MLHDDFTVSGEPRGSSGSLFFVLSSPEGIHHFFLSYRTFHTLSGRSKTTVQKGQKSQNLSLSSLITDLLGDLVCFTTHQSLSLSIT